jgi:hypothetical protein
MVVWGCSGGYGTSLAPESSEEPLAAGVALEGSRPRPVVTARPRTPRCAPARQPVNATLTAWMITATLTSLPSPRQPFKDVAVPRPV